MTALPTQFSIMVIDIESFSTRTNPILASLRREMYDVVKTAAESVHLSWDEFSAEDRGDGILMFIPPSISPVQLAGVFVRALDDGLAEKARMYSTAHAMRFRVSLHVGLASRDAHGWSGDAINFACRLVDAQPLRDVLKAATRARLAFIVSDALYQSVIRHEYRTIDAAAYLPVRFDVKQLHDVPAWVHVPGYAAPPGIPVTEASKGTNRDGADASVVQNAGVVKGDQVGGDKNITVDRPGSVRL